MNKEYIEEITLLSSQYMFGKKILNDDMIFLGKEYWTNTIEITNHFYGYKKVYVISSKKGENWHGYFCFNEVDSISGVRPVIKVNNLEEVIKDCKKTDENGIEIVEYGEFPDFDKQINVTGNLLEAETFYLPENKKDPKTGRKNNNNDFCLETIPVKSYFYNGKKVAEYKGKYYEVKPIEFLIDRENEMLISKKILFNSILDVDFDDNNRLGFSLTLLYKYLNHCFINYLKSNEETIEKQEEKLIIEKIQSLINDNEKLKSQIAQNGEILKFLQNRLEELDNNQNISKSRTKVLKR